MLPMTSAKQIDACPGEAIAAKADFAMEKTGHAVRCERDLGLVTLHGGPSANKKGNFNIWE